MRCRGAEPPDQLLEFIPRHIRRRRYFMTPPGGLRQSLHRSLHGAVPLQASVTLPGAGARNSMRSLRTCVTASRWNLCDVNCSSLRRQQQGPWMGGHCFSHAVPQVRPPSRTVACRVSAIRHPGLQMMSNCPRPPPRPCTRPHYPKVSIYIDHCMPLLRHLSYLLPHEVRHSRSHLSLRTTSIAISDWSCPCNVQNERDIFRTASVLVRPRAIVLS